MNGKTKLLITGGLANLGSWRTMFFSDKYDVFVLSKNITNKLIRLTNSYGAPKYKNSTKWYLVLNDLVKLAYEEKNNFKK